MDVKDSFKSFANRVMHAARLGKLSERDAKMLSHLLNKTGKKYTVISSALITSLGEGERGGHDVEMFARILEAANRRIDEGKEALTSEEKRQLETIFSGHALSAKVAKNFMLGVDLLLISQLMNTMRTKGSTTPKKVQEQTWSKDEKRKIST